jgi:hypothetical protein
MMDTPGRSRRFLDRDAARKEQPAYGPFRFDEPGTCPAPPR